MNQAAPLEHQSIDVQFLQELINLTPLELKVSSLNEESYRTLAYDERPVLDWLNHYQLTCCTERAFHIGVECLQQPRSGFLIGVYDSRIKRLHTLLLEPLSEQAGRVTSERLMSLVTYVALHFLTTYPNSVGAYIVDPPQAFLTHSSLFGYKVLDSWHDSPVMFATFDTLFECQQDVFYAMFNEEVLSVEDDQ